MPLAADKLSDVLHSCPHFDRLLTLCVPKQFYLIGGAIRDALLGLPVTDLDLICSEDPTAIARTFARQIGGHWFWLDQERRQSRVVVRHDTVGPNYDFALFRAPDLDGDLLDRDFTINALAIPLQAGMSCTELIDPCRGLEDLQQGLLRMVSDDSLANDPLRIIKGIRHATVLGFEIDGVTTQTMRQEVAGLSQVAAERIRQEVWKVLADKSVERGLQLLGECGAGQQLFGSAFAGALTELKQRVKSYRLCWQGLSAERPVVSSWLAHEFEQGLSCETLLIWTLLLASLSRQLPVHLAEEWRLSRKVRANIAAIAALNQVVLKEFFGIANNARAFAWWSARYRVDPKLFLLALVVVGLPEVAMDMAVIRGWVTLVDGLDDQRPADLVDGDWLRRELHLIAGPEMTKALQRLRNAEISGQVSSQEEARQFLIQSYHNRD